MKLEGKKIWITGASSGLGEILARKLSAKNQLILSARNKEKLEELVSELDGSGHIVFQLDVSTADVEEKTQSFLDHNFLPDVVFFNAGISQRALAREATPSVYVRLMDVNFFGVVKPFSVLMRNKPDDHKLHVVVTNSVAGKFGYWLRSGYAASKHALTGFFDVVALEEYQSGLRVTQIFPGRIATAINEHALLADASISGESAGKFSNAMKPDVVVDKIIRATQKEKSHVIIANLEWVPFIVYRLSKKWFFSLFSKRKPE